MGFNPKEESTRTVSLSSVNSVSSVSCFSQNVDCLWARAAQNVYPSVETPCPMPGQFRGFHFRCNSRKCVCLYVCVSLNTMFLLFTVPRWQSLTVFTNLRPPHVHTSFNFWIKSNIVFICQIEHTLTFMLKEDLDEDKNSWSDIPTSYHH